MFPKWPLTLKGQRYPVYGPLLPQVPSLIVSLYILPFLSYRSFLDKCTECPKMTLHTKRSKVPCIHVTTTPDSQISLCFTLRSIVFRLQAILRQLHWLTPKWPWRLKGQRYPIYILELTPSPKFHSISLYGQPFASYRTFWEKCIRWLQNDLKH